MCGIVGWINKSEDLRDKRQILIGMRDTMAKRGPDEEGYFDAKHALLGHRRLTVVDPVGGAQPMTKRLGNRTFSIVYNGELYNTEDIRKDLVKEGHEFISYSDTEVLLTAYIEWGEECVKHFNGIFAFGIWDENREILFMARDPLGVKPLFYTQRGNNFIFASEIKALLANPLVEPVIKEEGLLEIFGLGPARTLGTGVFNNINEMKPGEIGIFDGQTFKTKKYWSLEAREYSESLDTTVESVRSLLVDAVEKQLVSDLPLCTFLSGGLDSSAISSIAGKAFKRDGRGILRTYEIDYIDNDKYFKANEFQPNSDSIWADRMSDFIGSRHEKILLDNDGLVSTLTDAVRANDLPGMADVDSSLYMFSKAVRKENTVALSGECADEIFGGYPWYRKTEDMYSGTFPWSRAVNERKEILGGGISGIPLEDYVQSRYEDTLREVPHIKGESKEEYRMREMFYLNIRWFMITLLNRKDRMTMANSLEVRVPFADHRIVEYAFNIPRNVKFCDGREKGLLRRALKGILPEDILERRKSPYPKTHNPQYLKLVQQWMRDILSDKDSPILQVVNEDKIKQIVETGGAAFQKPWYGQLMTGPQLLAYFIQINEWMKIYRVKIEI